MKFLTVVLALILAAVVAFGLIFWNGSTLEYRVNCVTGEAAKYPDHFKEAYTVLKEGSAPMVFSDDLPKGTDGWRLVDIRIDLTDRGMFAAEWLNVTLSPATGDAAVYSLDGQGTDIPAHGTGTVELKLLTRAPADSTRTLTIQYYVYGIGRTLTVTC